MAAVVDLGVTPGCFAHKHCSHEHEHSGERCEGLGRACKASGQRVRCDQIPQAGSVLLSQLVCTTQHKLRHEVKVKAM